MKKILRRTYRFLDFIGINPITLINNLTGLKFYYRDLKSLKKQKGNDTTFKFGLKYPVLDDRNAESGISNKQYFHQDLFVAQLIFERKSQKHVDIGSRIDGFVSHVAAFRPIEVLDIRAQSVLVKNIKCIQADLLKLENNMIDYCDSISSLHVIEHIGLGRFGDTVDYYGHIKAIKKITQLLQKNGTFYFSVPIGNQRINFNAHRVFSLSYLLHLLCDDYQIRSFSYIDDEDTFHEDVKITGNSAELSFGCTFGCGIFELIKK